MDLSRLAPPHGARQKKKRVGRGPGSGLGKTSGRGHKGAQSRSGYSFKRGFEGGQMPLHRRVPKRGFNNKEFRIEYAVVNLDQLDKHFEAGGTVNPETLRAAGLLRRHGMRLKVLGRGELSKALTVHAHKFSGSAGSKVTAAGGTVEVLPQLSAALRRVVTAAVDSTAPSGGER